MSYRVPHETVERSVMDYCFYDDSCGGFSFPTKPKFLAFRYVVCTCSMAGKISNYGVERGHFSAIFIDEAGHATEPETVSAFSNLLSGDDDSTLIMSGDPMQLGPIVRSKNAIKGKLGVSMLERLMGGHSSKLYIRDIENFPATDGYV